MFEWSLLFGCYEQFCYKCWQNIWQYVCISLGVGIDLLGHVLSSHLTFGRTAILFLTTTLFLYHSQQHSKAVLLVCLLDICVSSLEKMSIQIICPFKICMNWLLSDCMSFFFFSGNGEWIQGLACVRQVLSHLSHAPSSFVVFEISHQQLPGWLPPSSPPASASWVAVITGFMYSSQYSLVM
jgi:hypothetical protein